MSMKKSSSLRLTVGMGQFLDFDRLVRAGADEVFCGFVPTDWFLRFGPDVPLNRREVRYVHVQAGSLEEMKILRRMSEKTGVPVTITFNSLSYEEKQLPVIAGYIKELMNIGFEDFILADLGLMLYLNKMQIPVRLHLSGEMGEWNPPMLRLLFSLFSDPEGPKIRRLIFHRKMSFSQMAACMEVLKEHENVEAEAFLFNEMCHYTGGFCNSLHCDELVHMCMVPYELRRIKPSVYEENACGKDACGREKTVGEETPFYESGTCGPKSCGGGACEPEPCEAGACGPKSCGGGACEPESCEESEETSYSSLPGSDGCGLCGLWQLRELGVLHMKIVGRGKSAEGMEEDLACVKKAIRILEESESEKEFIRRIHHLQKDLDCVNCYYPNLQEV